MVIASGPYSVDQITGNPFVDLMLAEMDPKEAAKAAKVIQRSAAGKDNAPSGRGATNANPLSTLDVVLSRFDVTRIPLSRLAQMRRDPIIAFALFSILAQLTRARWVIKSEDPQAAAFADRALRQIYPGLVAMFVEKLAYGYQACVKRFTQSLPDWTYVDDATGTEKPVWSNGSVKANVWKPFVPIHPMAADPLWDPAGAFNGIRYTPGNITTLSGTVGSADTDTQDYDVLHSLWFINELESVHNSLWGYPRTGYAYRFWWSFWFNWGLADRHFEKDADPPVKVYYPSNRPPINGASMRDLALMIGDRARSNSTIALPNDLIEGIDKTTNMHEWDVDFLKGGGNFEVFKERFDQVSSYIMQAMMIPPDTFAAKGGTAGYNATGNLLEAFQLAQINLMTDLDFVINEYMFPQLMAANGFEAKVTKITKGFDSVDIELAKALIQGKANSGNVTDLNIDWPELLDSTGIPRLNAVEIARKAQEIQGQLKPDPQQPAGPGEVGVTQQGLYYKSRDVIDLDRYREHKADSLLFSELAVAQISDSMIFDYASRLRGVWTTAISQDYTDMAQLLQVYASEELHLDETLFERWWRRTQERSLNTGAQAQRVLASIMRRASTIEFDEAGLRDFAWDPSLDDAAMRYLAERSGNTIEDINKTTRDELRRFLAELQSNRTPRAHWPDLVRAHFREFDTFRATRIVRSEVAQAYNFATLLAAQDAGIKKVKALDAQLGEARSDPHCIRRNGKIFTIEQAFKETRQEHPNGTLQWKIVPNAVSENPFVIAAA
jgi:hypothetical protein